MQIRHSNMLAQARFLRTKSEPRLVSFFRSEEYLASATLILPPLVLQTVGALARRRSEDQIPDPRSRKLRRTRSKAVGRR